MNEQGRVRRRNKLPDPRLQLTITGAFLAVGLICLVFQFGITSRAMMDVAQQTPGLADDSMVSALGLRSLVLSVALIVPITLAVGVFFTFRIAGPIRKLENHLKRLAAGERPSPCRLRDGDELQELCRLVNEAVETLSAAQADFGGTGSHGDIEESTSEAETAPALSETT